MLDNDEDGEPMELGVRWTGRNCRPSMTIGNAQD